METTDVIVRLKRIIIDSMQLSVDLDSIIGKDLIAELGINSVDALEIMVWIENTFDIQIPDEDLDSSLLREIEHLANYIIARRKVQA